jgi:hypothetical protein
MSISDFQWMFKNPFFYGVMKFNGELYEGKHEPIISKRLKTDIATCEKQTDLLLDMRLNEQISEPEYISKKCVLVNQKAELKGKLEAFERNRQNRFEPAIRFILEAKQATILLAEGNQEKNRDFLKKIGSNFQMAEKSLAVEFKKPWDLLAEFNSAPMTKHAACGEISSKLNWRREGDSNPRYGFWPYNGLANHRLQPLGHLSIISTEHNLKCVVSA